MFLASAPITPQSFYQPILDMVGGTVPSLPKAILIFLIGVVIIRILSKILASLLGLTKLPKALIKVSVRLLDIILWLLLTIAVFQLLGLTNVALALSGSVAVLALAFSNGISSTVTDTISGLNLARDRHFRIGDKVIAGDRKTEGIIVDLDIRKARLKDDKGMVHIIPNGLIDKNEWVLVERAGAKTALVANPRQVNRRTRVGAGKLVTIGKKRSL